MDIGGLPVTPPRGPCMAQNNEAYYIIVCDLQSHANTLAGSRLKA